MSDKLKSAWELALEKLQAQEGEPPATLSKEQKAEIADIRRRYRARIAEAEIGAESSIKKAVESGDFEGVEKIQQNLVSEKARLNREMAEEVEKARASH